MMRHIHLLLGAVATLLPTLNSAPAKAGPPYVTDDPVPAEAGTFETYLYGAALRGDREIGLDINYGAGQNLQITAVLPVSFNLNERASAGEIEAGAKVRLLRQTNGAFADVAVFPTMSIPVQTGETRLLLPVWVQRSFGPWSVFGGAGVGIPLNDRGRRSWITGLAIEREVAKSLSVGSEVFHSSSEKRGTPGLTGVGVGFDWTLSKNLALLTSGGPRWSGPKTSLGVYIALQVVR